MLLEAIAAGLVGVALLWLVLQPLIAPTPLGVMPIDLPDPEETPRGQALLALKEIEFDRATGKLSDADYQALNAKYTALALAALEPDAEPAAAQRPAAAAGSERRCLVHGGVPAGDARFCPACGAGLVDAAGRCVTCHGDLPSDAAFCPGCGARVRAA